MKNIFAITVCILTLIIACNSPQSKEDHQHTSSQDVTQQDTIKKSIPKKAHAQIGKVHVMITYHAPAVRGRTIWGGLVPYGEVWVTGAHNATALTIDKEIEIAGIKLSAGKYALFTIPGKDLWTFIINKNWEQHLTDEYDEKDDLLKITVTPDTTLDQRERLTYNILSTSQDEGEIVFRWEKVGFSIPFKSL